MTTTAIDGTLPPAAAQSVDVVAAICLAVALSAAALVMAATQASRVCGCCDRFAAMDKRASVGEPSSEARPVAAVTISVQDGAASTTNPLASAENSSPTREAGNVKKDARAHGNGALQLRSTAPIAGPMPMSLEPGQSFAMQRPAGVLPSAKPAAGGFDPRVARVQSLKHYDSMRGGGGRSMRSGLRQAPATKH